MLGQGANGDVIDAGFSKFADGVERHVAGHLKLRLAVCAFDRLTHLLRVEVIEHDDVSPRFNGLVQLLQRFHFHFDRHIRM